MLRTNLSTRPFYNDRAVRIGLGAAVLAVAALTLFNGLQVLTLNARNTETSARAEQAEASTLQSRERARAIAQALDKVEVTAVQTAAGEANRLIEQRSFSWTDLFNRFETTLPADVRIAAVAPQFDNDGRLLIVISTVAREVEDLHQFIDRLEADGGLREVIPRQQDVQADGTLRAVLQGYYAQPGTVAPADPAATASESDAPAQEGANQSAPAPNATPGAAREERR